MTDDDRLRMTGPAPRKPRGPIEPGESDGAPFDRVTLHPGDEMLLFCPFTSPNAVVVTVIYRDADKPS